MPYRFTSRPILWRNFLSWGSLPSNEFVTHWHKTSQVSSSTAKAYCWVTNLQHKKQEQISEPESVSRRKYIKEQGSNSWRLRDLSIADGRGKRLQSKDEQSGEEVVKSVHTHTNSSSSPIDSYLLSLESKAGPVATLPKRFSWQNILESPSSDTKNAWWLPFHLKKKWKMKTSTGMSK